MAVRTKLIYATATPLVAYVLLTAVWILPDWDDMTTTQAFSMAKHLGVVLLIVGMLYFRPRLGAWAALLWCVVVPLERYLMLFQDLANVLSGEALSISGIDVARLVLLMLSAVISGLCVFKMHYGRKAEADEAVNA